jgi:hypothetical protein
VQTKQAADVLVEGFEEMQYAVFTGKTKSYQLISKGEIKYKVYCASLVMENKRAVIGVEDFFHPW